MDTFFSKIQESLNALPELRDKNEIEDELVNILMLSDLEDLYTHIQDIEKLLLQSISSTLLLRNKTVDGVDAEGELDKIMVKLVGLPSIKLKMRAMV